MLPSTVENMSPIVAAQDQILMWTYFWILNDGVSLKVAKLLLLPVFDIRRKMHGVDMFWDN